MLIEFFISTARLNYSASQVAASIRVLVCLQKGTDRFAFIGCCEEFAISVWFRTDPIVISLNFCCCGVYQNHWGSMGKAFTDRGMTDFTNHHIWICFLLEDMDMNAKNGFDCWTKYPYFVKWTWRHIEYGY